MIVEPEQFVPVIPMILINGSQGIGTGWSTTVPNFNPLTIISNIKRMLNGEQLEPMVPWYRGFTGEMEKIDEKR